MAEYVVTATRLYTLDKDSNRVRHFRGDKISGLSAADVERFKLAGAIAAVSSDEAKAATEAPETTHPAEVSAPPDPDDLPDPLASDIVAAQNSGGSGAKRPAQVASKEVWQRYAVESGQLTEAEAKDAKLADLKQLK